VIRLESSCHCGAVRFTVESRHPYPVNLCYCSICRKTAGVGGFAINLRADSGIIAGGLMRRLSTGIIHRADAFQLAIDPAGGLFVEDGALAEEHRSDIEPALTPGVSQI